MRKFAKALEEGVAQLELSDDERVTFNRWPSGQASTPNSSIRFLIFRVPSLNSVHPDSSVQAAMGAIAAPQLRPVLPLSSHLRYGSARYLPAL